jgi:hypothetical protein
VKERIGEITEEVKKVQDIRSLDLMTGSEGN